LTSWKKTGGGQLSSPLTFSNVRKQILWANIFITLENKYLIFKEWINSGIYKLIVPDEIIFVDVYNTFN
jgi:hypothetical protein